MESAQDEETSEPEEPSEPEELKNPTGIDEPELKLPDWIKPDPEAGDKGKLLYIEEWAKRRRFEDRIDIPMGIIVIGLGLGLIGLALSVGISSMDEGIGGAIIGFIMFAAIGGFVMFLGYLMVIMGFRGMPLSIWKNGVTRTYVPIEKGKQRMEVFVSWNDVERVKYDSTMIKEYTIIKTWIDLKGEETIPFSGSMEFDIFHVLSLLNRLIPEKVDQGIKQLVGEDLAIRSSLLMKKRPLNYVDGMMFVLILFIISMISMVIQDMRSEGFQYDGLLVLIVFFAPVVIFTHMLINFSDNSSQRDLIEYSARIQKDGISIPKTIVGLFTKHIRSFIPWNQITMVRLKLNYAFYSHEGEIELVNGDRFRIPLEAYHSIADVQCFRKVGNDFFNEETASPCSATIRWSYSKLTLFFGILLLPLLFPIVVKPLLFIIVAGLVIALFIVMVLLMIHPDEFENSSKLRRFYQR